MRRLLPGALAILFSAIPLLAAEPRDCVDLSASIDNDVSSPSGVRVTIVGRNRCSEDVDGRETRFRVTAVGPGGSTVSTQRGRFGGSISPRGQAETKVFVACEPDRVRSVRVEHH